MDVPKILAFDFGLTRIGVAASFGTLAEPLAVVINDDDVWTNLDEFVNELQPDMILVGVSEREMAQLSQDFGQQLEEHFLLPVKFWDETLSSVEVQRKLHDRDRGRHKYKGPIDHYAATVILQNYLDETYA